jgi:ribonuclease VapC
VIALDSSAIVTIAKGEADQQRFRDAIAGFPCMIGAPSLLEVKMVLSSLAEAKFVDRFLDGIGVGGDIRVADFTPAMADAAVDAFRRYGKGRGHLAKLNFGDCMSYAVAKVHGVPLLYKGNDFAQTDIASALS